MAGYEDTKEKIISTLMGRKVGTEIQPENHQDYALNMLDYIRSLELIATSTLIGIANPETNPVQPNDSRVCYIAGVAQDRTTTFINFRDQSGNGIQITNGEMQGSLVILMWNTQYWSAEAVPTSIISSSEQANFYYNMNIRKTYTSVNSMNADVTNPVGTDGRSINIGDIVSVVNSNSPEENGFYSYIGSGWVLQSAFNWQVVQTKGNDINTSMSQKSISDIIDSYFGSITSSAAFNKPGYVNDLGVPVESPSWIHTDFLPINIIKYINCFASKATVPAISYFSRHGDYNSLISNEFANTSELIIGAVYRHDSIPNIPATAKFAILNTFLSQVSKSYFLTPDNLYDLSKKVNGLLPLSAALTEKIYGEQIFTVKDYIQSSDGALNTSPTSGASQFYSTDFLPVQFLKGGSGFSGGNLTAAVAYYDSQYNFISSLVFSGSKLWEWTANAPFGSSFYRASTRKEDFNSSYIEKITQIGEKASHGYSNDEIVKTLKEVEIEAKLYQQKSTVFPRTGFYVTAGGFNTSANWRTADLEVKEGEIISYGLRSATGANLITTFDANDNKIDSIPALGNVLTLTEGSYTVPAGGVKVGLSTSNNYSDAYFIMKENLDAVITGIIERLDGSPSGELIYVVKKNVPEDSTTFNTIGKATQKWKKGVKIKVFEGVYEERSINVPDGCEIYGIGNVEIRGELPNNASSSDIENISTIDMFNGGFLGNLTITARNMRYPIHADFSSGNIHKRIRNCRFIHYGNSEAYDYRVQAGTGTESEIVRAMSAWGGGTKAGDIVEIDGCYFESPMRAFSTHNNLNFNTNFGASYVIVRNSIMNSQGIDRDGSNLPFLVSVHIQSLASNAPDKVIFESCIINGYMCMQTDPTQEVYCDTPRLKQIWNNAGGSGNIAFIWAALNVNWYPKIKGEVSPFKNVSTSTIQRGKAVKRNGIGISLFTNADNVNDFFGVTMQNIEPGKSGDVKYSGYIPLKYLTGSNSDIAVGVNISVDNLGSFVISDTFPVMKSEDNNNILIK